MEASAASIRAAEEVGATNVPRASLHLQLAKEASERASKLVEDGDNEEASLVLMRAEADAELALALARNEREKNQARQASEKVRELQESESKGL